jgi:hypothetical protein
MFKSYGTLRYDPKRLKRYDEWWMVLMCDNNLAKYYRHLASLNRTSLMNSGYWLNSRGLNSPEMSWDIKIPNSRIISPYWGAHISVVRGEEPVYKWLWGKHSGKRIVFYYDPVYINTNGRHWWMRITCPELEHIRCELGLTPQPTYFCDATNKYKLNHMHFTFGKNLESLSSRAEMLLISNKDSSK